MFISKKRHHKIGGTFNEYAKEIASYSKMSKIGLIILFAGLIITNFAGCNSDSSSSLSKNPQPSVSSSTSNNEEEGSSLRSDEYVRHSITFPATMQGKTENNAEVFEIPPFELSFVLPEGWSMEIADVPLAGEKEFHYLNNNVWSIIDVISSDGECIGAIGYNIYELYEGAEDLPQAIYSQIALGNDYRFDAQDAYKTVNITDSECTAITDVLYSEAFMESMGLGREEKQNRGILSYNKDRLVYIAMEFEQAAVGTDTIQTIAKSIHFQDPSDA